LVEKSYYICLEDIDIRLKSDHIVSDEAEFACLRTREDFSDGYDIGREIDSVFGDFFFFLSDIE
jgi:hypothetical protein